MRLRNLDILRACLALMVLGGHARMLLWMPWHTWKELPHPWWALVLGTASGLLRYGREAVMVFFTLSGFFIHLRAASQIYRRPTTFTSDTRDYLKRRARRILPPLYAALLLTVLLDSVGSHFFPRLYSSTTGDQMLDDNFRASGLTPRAVIPALLAQPSLLNVAFGSNHPLWSISNEIGYYLLYPLFLAVWRHRKWLAYALGAGVSFMAWMLPFAGPWGGMLACYPVWLAGALLADILAGHRQLSSNRGWFWAALLVAGTSFAFFHLEAVKTCGALQLMSSIAFGTSVVAVFEALPEHLAGTQVGRLLEWLGVRSYSLYIFHFPVLVLMSAATFQTCSERPASGWLAAGGTLVALLGGLLGFQWVESRFLPARPAILCVKPIVT